MASALDERCPICLDTWSNAGYVLPCLHRFCFKCIHRWAERKPKCPLCKGRVTSIVHSVQADNNFEEVTIRPPVEAFVVIHRRRRAHGGPAIRSSHRPAASQSLTAGFAPSCSVGAHQASTWASLFREYPDLLQSLLPWLRGELRQFFGHESWEAAAAEGVIMSSLRLVGLDENALIRLLWLSLRWHTVIFVQKLVDIIVHHCSREARHLLGLPASSTASAGTTPAPNLSCHRIPAASSVEELPSSSTAALQRGPSYFPPTPVPIPGEEEQLQEEGGEAAEGPTAPAQGTHHSHGGLWCPQQRSVGRCPHKQAHRLH